MWSARAEQSVEPGDVVQVVRRDGLTLKVKPDERRP